MYYVHDNGASEMCMKKEITFDTESVALQSDESIKALLLIRSSNCLLYKAVIELCVLHTTPPH